MATALTNNDLATAAAKLSCETAVIRAVDEVESGGTGFKNGRIVLRFETAVFQKYTGKTVNGSGQSSFDKAYKISPHYALMSTSWGRYQIMGFNYEVCGFSTVESFVALLKTGEVAQLNAFVAFVQGKHIADELSRHDWVGFARVYNGANQAKNGYATKLAKAYLKYKNVLDLAKKPVFRIDPEIVWILVGVCVVMAITFIMVRSSTVKQLAIG